jgi:hypothetical protein
MPIHRLLESHVFSPEEIAVIGMAFEAALDKLGLVGRDDPATEFVALKIIELAQQGVRDADELCERAVKALAW